MIKIYLVSITEFNREEEAAYLSFCDEQRRQKTPKYKHEADRVRSIAAGLLLQYAYAVYKRAQGQKAILPCEIEYNKDGKPYVAGDEGFFFSISHAKDYVLVAVSEEEIGADIEQIVVNKDVFKLAKRFFHPSEVETLLQMEDIEQQNRYFTQIWTMKESYIKYLGVGLRYGMQSFKRLEDGTIYDESRPDENGIVHVSFETAIEGYCISICSHIESMQDEMERIPLQKIMQELQS